MKCTKAMYHGVMRELHGFGVRVDKMYEGMVPPTVYISVPESSELKTITPESIDIAGKYLASKFKDTVNTLFIKDAIVKVKIRKGETWTETDRQNAYRKYDDTYRGVIPH